MVYIILFIIFMALSLALVLLGWLMVSDWVIVIISGVVFVVSLAMLIVSAVLLRRDNKRKKELAEEPEDETPVVETEETSAEPVPEDVAAEEAPAAAKPELAVGVFVVHDDFGLGTVISINEEYFIVRFEEELKLFPLSAVDDGTVVICEFTEPEGKKHCAADIYNGKHISHLENCGSDTVKIYDKYGRVFGWNSYMPYSYAPNRDLLCVFNATKEGYATWFIKHDNIMGNTDNPNTNDFFLNGFNTLEERLTGRDYANPLDSTTRVIFARIDESDPDYYFMGVYEFIDMRYDGETIVKTYNRLSETYPAVDSGYFDDQAMKLSVTHQMFGEGCLKSVDREKIVVGFPGENGTEDRVFALDTVNAGYLTISVVPCGPEDEDAAETPIEKLAEEPAPEEEPAPAEEEPAVEPEGITPLEALAENPAEEPAPEEEPAPAEEPAPEEEPAPAEEKPAGKPEVIAPPEALAENPADEPAPASKPVSAEAVIGDGDPAEFVFADEWSYRDRPGYRVYNSNGVNIGNVFMTDDKRKPSYGNCELYIYPEYRRLYGGVVNHRIMSNGERIPWNKMCETLKEEGEYRCRIDKFSR